MTDIFQEPDDATPLTIEEKRELILSRIAFRADLNEAEQANIARAHDWALGQAYDLAAIVGGHSETGGQGSGEPRARGGKRLVCTNTDKAEAQSFRERIFAAWFHQ